MVASILIVLMGNVKINAVAQFVFNGKKCYN